MPRSRKGQVFTDIVLEVFKLSGLLVAEGDELTRELGLSSARWKVLGALAHADTPLTVPQIAHAMGQTRQSVQRLADVMEEAGMLVYQNNPLHKRAKLVALSARGAEVFELLEKKQAPWANAHAAPLSTRDMEVALSVLRKMVERLES